MEHKGGSKAALRPGTSSSNNCLSLSLGFVLSTSRSLIPLQGHVGVCDLLFSFWGAVCLVQSPRVTPKITKFQTFYDLSWWDLL